MPARPLIAALVFLSACGSYIGTGPAPSVGVPRAISIEIKVSGDEKGAVEEALGWVIAGNRNVRRVKSGGDAVLTLGGKLKQERAILAGTDCVWRVQLVAVAAGGEELLNEAREFKADGLTSNVPNETEKLITRSVVWALERASTGLSIAPPPPSSPAVATPSVEPEETPPPVEPATPARKKPRRRR